jgi:malate dehydrogenase
MQVTVVGTGNVGAGLIFRLGAISAIDTVQVMSRNQGNARAAIMDLASAAPEAAMKFSFEQGDGIAESDVIVITAGVNQKGKTADETHGDNLEICRSVLKKASLKSSAVVICIGTPVDYITAQVQKECGLPSRQVMGFGGDLDTNRLRYILQQRGNPDEFAQAVGEHGPNAVPVYQGEQEYSAVAEELRGFWSILAGGVDVVRNIATAELLYALVDSVVNDSMAAHNICAMHPEHGIYLTWPFKVGKFGVEEPLPLMLGDQAFSQLQSLVAQRRGKLSAI